MWGKARLLVLSVLTLWTFSVVMLWPLHGVLLDWDEVDYVNAARLGLLANALDGGSLPPTAFVRFGLAKRYGTTPSLPDGYEERLDPLILRHYHPPFVVLLLAPLAHVKSERGLRLVQLAGSLALAAAVLFSMASIAGSVGWAELLLVGVLTVRLIHWSFGSISFHGWEGVWATASAAFVSQWLRDRSRRAGVLLGAAAALALGTLETAALVWVGALICLFLWSPPWRRGERAGVSPRRLASGLIVASLFLVMLWPGSVLKMSLVKIAGFHFYRVGRGEEYAETVRHLLGNIFPVLPLLVLFALSAAYLLWKHRSESIRWGPFLVMGLTYGIPLGRFGIALQYFVPAMAPLLCVVGFAGHRLAHALGPWVRVGLVGLSAFLLLPLVWPGDHWAQAEREDQLKQGEVRFLASLLRRQEALVDGGHTYQYYLGSEYTIHPITVAYDGKALLVRERGIYRALEREDVEGKVVVIQNNRERFFSGPVPANLLGGCLPIRRPALQVYDCSKAGN